MAAAHSELFKSTTQVALGDKFGKLTVLALPRKKYATCLCDCGKIKDVRLDHLVSGKIVSCRCHRISKARTHGKSRTPEFTVWQNMRKRCGNPSHPEYPNYGGRGITVCNSWQNSFENFASDMGNRPSHLYSLDRVNNDGNYEPGNCRWTTNIEQCNNTRKNIWIKCDGKNRTIAQWSRITGVKQGTIYSRHMMRGESGSERLFRPARKLSKSGHS